MAAERRSESVRRERPRRRGMAGRSVGEVPINLEAPFIGRQ
jgi:hypothetical protein